MGSLLQSPWWGRVKGGGGWTATAIATAEAPSLQVLQRSIGPLQFAYVPYGWEQPDSQSIPPTPETVVAEMHQIVGRLTRRPHLLRWDVPWSTAQFDTTAAARGGLRPAAMRVQPPDTVVLDLSPGEDDLLAAMKAKTRYNIRLASKREVQVERIRASQASSAEREGHLRGWYQVYQQTAQRDRITIHPLEYYRRILDLAADTTVPAPIVDLYRASHDGDDLGGVITASWEGTTTYLYGAGADIKRNYMASYLLQWRAIGDARARGDRQYDFFGIPPAADPNHPMHGLYRFKTGFGGAIVHRPGPWDLPIAPVPAAVFRLAERGRRWYHHDVRKRGGSGE